MRALDKKDMINEMIAFIICYDNERYLEECIYYINKLQIPCGFDIDIISIKEADNLVFAYNAAMAESHAKYKIYLEQHTFLICDTFLYDMLAIFQNDCRIGMLGVLGGTETDKLDVGRLLIWKEVGVDEVNYQSGELPYYPVNTLHGMFMATQYDIEWEGDCSVSHCYTMRQQGYEVVIPYQKSNWCMYDCGDNDLNSFESEYRFLLRRVETCHDMACAEIVRELLEKSCLSYEEHIEQVEQQAYGKSMAGYYWEDFLLSDKKSEKYLSANGTVWIDNREKNVMHVVTAFNHKYAVYAAVMLQSLYENNPLCQIYVHVLQQGLTLKDRVALENQAAEFENHILFYDFKREWLSEELQVTLEWSIEAYFRLFMVDLLPKYVERVLYLDVDIIINKPIYDFYFMDMQGKDIVGCRDFSLILKEDFTDKRKELFASVKTEKNFCYFNSGVILVNIAKLRGNICGEYYMKTAAVYKDRLLAPDQDILNLVHWKNVGLVEEYRYDLFQSCLKDLQVKEVKQYVSMIHYAGAKPWMEIDIRLHAYRIWWEYAVRTRMASEFIYQTIRKEKEKGQELKKALNVAKYCRHVPFMSCEVHGIKYIGSSMDRIIMPMMYNTRENWSKEEIDIFFALSYQFYGQEAVETDGIFLDIGGNIGTTSIYVLKEAAPNLRVLAFEPMKDNLKMFKANCILNDIGNDKITIVEKAVSNRTDIHIMEENIFNPGMSHIVGADAKEIGNTEQVESIALDDYLQSNGISYTEVKYIWMDVEGFEGLAVDGAKELLSNCRIPICMEFVPKYLKRQGCYELLIKNLETLYSGFIWLDEYKTMGKEKVRRMDSIRRFGEELGEEQADIFLIK